VSDAPRTAEAVAELRHELRTPLNHIVGYAEMLVEDAVEAGRDDRRAALELALAAARDALGHISHTLAPARESVEAAELAALFTALRDPQRRILEAVRPLLAGPDAGPGDALGDDLRRILKAAERLTPGFAVAPAAPGATGEHPAASAAPVARILVVDDVEDMREVLRRRLTRQGYEVECVEDGSRALARVAQSAFDLVLLDVLMPGIDGYEVLRRLKDQSATRDIPVIMISALDDIPSIVKCIESGAEDVLPKPFDPVLLKARISASLEKKRLRDQEKEYLRQVLDLAEAAKAVEAGRYRTEMLGTILQRDDALGRLARIFDGMAASVHSREQRLRERIAELRTDIGEVRTQTADHVAAVDGDSLPAGSRFSDRYEILAAVGSGGMGSVYRARDLELGEEIAIKTLRPEFTSDAGSIERFKSEIRLARRITHPNVVRTHDFGEWGGVYFLTMEYVEGVTVRDLLDMRGKLTAPSTLAIGTQLAESLAVAHERGIIHRDIKPQNLLLDDDGLLKVMDFGVARLAERAAAVTEVGMVVGTPAYMSPEQLMSEPLDARSDLYAAGVVLYECVTGRLPFESASPISLIAKLLHQEAPPPTELNGDVPPALSTLIMRLLAKKPADRVQSAAELAQLLVQLS
jgi:CheY-like chemotaxis protein